MRLLKGFQYIICSLLVIFIHRSEAQPLPFWNDIQHFKKEDSLSFPSQNAILFTGSSSFTKWTDVQSYFPGFTIINRGFGGSSLPDIIHYANDIIIPYQPRQILIYCGDNDLAASDTVTALMVRDRFKKLFYLVRRKLKNATFSFVSIKPSPSRKHLMPKMVLANSLIKKFLKNQKNTSFIDVFHPMMLPGGHPRPEIFLADSLHMNEKGYQIWKKAIMPHLKKS